MFRLCSEVFDEYLAHCEARLQRQDMAAATVSSYRKILDGVWRPQIGRQIFYQVCYSRLVAITDGYDWSKKTYNNALSVLRRAFDFGYRDRPLQENPARCLRSARILKIDRPKIDPFCMHDAETLIVAIHRDWGEAQGNYDEFRFFTLWTEAHKVKYVAAQFMSSTHAAARDSVVLGGPLHHINFA
jgi:site-specific recombinase XerD